jgi:hypothetical protein
MFESFGRPHSGFGRFFFPVTWRRIRDQGIEELPRDECNIFNSFVERDFVCFRGLVKTADLTDELKSAGSNFILRSRRREVVEGFDVSAHRWSIIMPQADPINSAR